MLSPACAPRADGPRHSTVPRPSPVAQLQHDLETLFTTGQAARVLWGVRVLAASPPGQLPHVLYDRNPAQLLMPASNMKILTLAAAAERLGWDYRFDTIVRATAPIDEHGTIRGDIVVVGSVDPTISRRFDGSATLASWAQLLWELGVRRVEGRVLGDASRFPSASIGAGWEWDDLAYGYAARISALSYNENTAELLVAPGPSLGAAASVTAIDIAPGIDVRSTLKTSNATARRLQLAWAPDDGVITIRGEVPLGYTPFKAYVAVPDPPQYFAQAVRAALIARGIVVNGGAASAETDPPGPDAPEAPVLFRHHSPTLREIAVPLMKVSQNLYAELLLRTLGVVERSDASQGPAVLTDVLDHWGAGPDAAIVADGSGLSRHNLTSAHTVALVLTRMLDPRHREAWLAALPVAGVDGTLERRMRGTPAEGRVYAKTGSIGYVRSLSGYARTAEDKWMTFSIIANNFAGSVAAADVDRITEAAVNRLVVFATEPKSTQSSSATQPRSAQR